MYVLFLVVPYFAFGRHIHIAQVSHRHMHCMYILGRTTKVQKPRKPVQSGSLDSLFLLACHTQVPTTFLNEKIASANRRRKSTVARQLISEKPELAFRSRACFHALDCRTVNAAQNSTSILISSPHEPNNTTSHISHHSTQGPPRISRRSVDTSLLLTAVHDMY